MTMIPIAARLRARPRFAFWHHLRRLFLKARPSAQHTISDHIARDIGLSAHDLEVLRHQWPSEASKPPGW